MRDGWGGGERRGDVLSGVSNLIAKHVYSSAPPEESWQCQVHERSPPLELAARVWVTSEVPGMSTKLAHTLFFLRSCIKNRTFFVSKLRRNCT